MVNEQTLRSLASVIEIVPGRFREPMKLMPRITRETAEFIVQEMERSGRTAREVLEECLRRS